MNEKGHIKDSNYLKTTDKSASNDSFVLDKSIFSNIFEKDIKRVYIYKKTERLSKAIYLLTPAFENSVSLRNKIESIAVALVDAAILPPVAARLALSRELLALSSILSIARNSAIISVMNAELISREAHLLLSEIAQYEEPRLFMDEVLSLPELYKSVAQSKTESTSKKVSLVEDFSQQTSETRSESKRHLKDIHKTTPRRDAVIDVLKSKGPSYIKDISTVVIDVSEKTIQRELNSLIAEGLVAKKGDRRWTTYSLI